MNLQRENYLVMGWLTQYGTDVSQIRPQSKSLQVSSVCMLGKKLEDDSKLYTEMQRTKNSHGIFKEEKQSWKQHTTRQQNLLQSQL